MTVVVFYGAFTHDITAAKFVSQNNETATMFLFLMNGTEVSIKTPPASLLIKG